MEDHNGAPQMDLDELMKTRRKNNHRKNKVYSEILKLCHNRIRHCATTTSENFCIYEIPLFVAGLPKFKIKPCVRYCLTKLRKNGFDVMQDGERIIKISWLRYENKTKQKALIKRNNKIVKFNPNKNTFIPRITDSQLYMIRRPPSR